jgi:hypothetical protein
MRNSGEPQPGQQHTHSFLPRRSITDPIDDSPSLPDMEDSRETEHRSSQTVIIRIQFGRDRVVPARKTIFLFLIHTRNLPSEPSEVSKGGIGHLKSIVYDIGGHSQPHTNQIDH